MFGNPARNTNNGVQALLAIANGQVLKDLKRPTGSQKAPKPDDEDMSDSS